MQRLEWVLHDMRIGLASAQASGADERITIVDIDEPSLREPEQGGEGRWPWPRDRLAALAENLLQDQGAAVVGLDIILSGRHEHDDRLAQAMSLGPVVVGEAFHTGGGSSGEQPPGLDPSAWRDARFNIRSHQHYIGVVPALRQAATGSGHLNPLRDEDGVTRRVPMFIEHAGRWHPAFSLSVLQAVSEAPPPRPVFQDYGGLRGIEAVEVAGLQIPVDEALQAVVPFRGGAQPVPVVSAADVSRGRLPAGTLSGRIVLVGSSASGLADLVTTPLHTSLPGVQVHAELIAGLLDERVPRQPAYSRTVQTILILLLGLPLAIWGAAWRPAVLVSAATLMATSLFVANVALLAQQTLLFPMAAPLLAILLPTLVQVAWGYGAEARTRRQLAALFSSYVPPEIVQRMAENPAAYDMKPVERELSVLFADVRGFTTISERLTPQELADWINEYLTAMSLVIREGHHGTLDKYIGDAVMAFWGAPVDEPAHAQQAVSAALAMQAEAHRLSLAFAARGWPELAIGVGVNSGTMRVGDMGSKVRRAYTVMGDAVNLGSRLEGLTRVYGVDVLIGQDTRDQLVDWVCKEVDRVRVKGKHEPVSIFEPLGPRTKVSQADKSLVERWHGMLAELHGRRWHTARRMLLEIERDDPGRALCQLYLERIDRLAASPPGSDWDGVTTFASK
jgi:adenylate cyclase